MNFQELEELLARTDILDASYPVKGTFVWLPTGVKLKENVFGMIKGKVDELGYEQYQFPRLMPGEALRIVSKHIQNFEEKVFWLRKGDQPLDTFLSPTGECGIYPMFKQWIRTHADLPLRVYQIGNTFRSHKHSYALINADESGPLLEAHAAFATKREAEEEFDVVVDLLKDVHEELGIPYRAVIRPKWGNNPVAEKNVSFETYFPPKKVNLNQGVAYLQGQIFSKAFGIKFVTKEGFHEHTHQLTFGINERVLAAMLSLHADQYGLQLLPKFSPMQVVIVPIYTGEEDSKVREYSEYIGKQLNGIRVYIDDSSKYLPRKKFPIWREKGVPIRIGISLEDVKNQTARVYRRDRKDPETLSSLELNQKIPQYLNEITSYIYNQASKIFEEKIVHASSYSDISRLVGEYNIVRFEWCGIDKCGIKIEEGSVGEILGSALDEMPKGECINCGNKASVVAYFAKRAYSP